MRTSLIYSNSGFDWLGLTHELNNFIIVGVYDLSNPVHDPE